jgi:hypothetical protein
MKGRVNGVVQEWAAFSSADVSLPVARYSRAVRLCCTYQQDYRERSVIARVHLLFLHVLQQDMLVVLPFSLLFRSTPRGEAWKGSEAHHFFF